jgi:hypothetical protein
VSVESAMNRKRGGNPYSQDVAEIVRTASLLVSCDDCGKLHKPECPLALHPICPACTGRYQMASLRMEGCYPLDEAKIDEEVTRVSPGNYALGYVGDGRFVASYVGRSDSDVNDRLHSWTGVYTTSTSYGPSARASHVSRHRNYIPLRTPALRPVGVVVDGRYTHFRFSYAASPQEAFEKECCNYHDFGGSYGLDNERHPAPSEGESWKCPMHGHHHRWR